MRFGWERVKCFAGNIQICDIIILLDSWTCSYWKVASPHSFAGNAMFVYNIHRCWVCGFVFHRLKKFAVSRNRNFVCKSHQTKHMSTTYSEHMQRFCNLCFRICIAFYNYNRHMILAYIIKWINYYYFNYIRETKNYVNNYTNK